MKLKFSSKKDLIQVWKNDFLSCQGLLLPGDQGLRPGQKREFTILVEGKELGIIKAKVAWQNIYGKHSEYTPYGTFIRIVSIDQKLQHFLNDT